MKVGLIPTCTVDVIAPEVGLGAHRLLRHVGCDVIAARAHICCAQPAYNAGYWGEARSVAGGFVQAAGKLIDDGAEYVVVPSGSCVAMVRAHFETLFGRVPPGADRIVELSQFLVGVLGLEDVGATFEARAVYHPSCHGRRLLGIRDEPTRLLSKVRGLTLLDLPREEDCCGFGGTFSIKLPAVSTAMADEKARHVLASGAGLAITNDMACGLQLRGRLQRLGQGPPVRHWVEVLDPGRAPA